MKKNIAWNTCYQLLLVLSPLIIAPYISRTLGVTGVGAYSYASSCQFFLAMFAVLGTSSYGMRTIARARDDREEYSRLFWEIELMTVISSLVCILIWGIFVFFVSKYRVLYIILTLNLLNCMLDISWFYAGLEMFRYTVAKNAFFRVLSIVLQFLLVTDENCLYIYAAILMTTELLGTLTLWIPLRKLVYFRRIKLINLRTHFMQTMIYFIPAISTSVYTLLDKILLGAITQSEYENGYYEQATKVINALKALTFVSLNTVLGSRLSYLFAKNNNGEIRNRIRNSLDYILYFGFGLCFGILAVAECFVPVFFGQQYTGTVPVLMLMSPLIIIIGLSNCLGSHYYTPSGRRRESAIYIMIGATANLLMNLILIPRFNSIGAVISTLIAESVITVLYFWNSKGYIEYRVLGHQILKKLVAAGIMFAALKLQSNYLGVSIQSLLIQIVTGMIIYVVVLHILRDSMQRNLETLLIKRKGV